MFSAPNSPHSTGIGQRNYVLIKRQDDVPRRHALPGSWTGRRIVSSFFFRASRRGEEERPVSVTGLWIGYLGELTDLLYTGAFLFVFPPVSRRSEVENHSLRTNSCQTCESMSSPCPLQTA
ncbi:hypothetical protein F2P79_008334 [Pimephales promelas]|nr:hypothetical protein F2P79_008334 [Pimephales promelas]